ncbi:MAG TPA: hypothetical protein VJM31_02350 [Vicinamibacterales bacterium]|nr:hypothetical protein [Vicinamibacterales bacterium]
MMTRSTLKALWLGGGGLLATWLAVTPGQGVPASATGAAPPAVTRGATAEDLNAQAERLRSRTKAVALRPSTRNPFRFSATRSVASAGASRALVPGVVAQLTPAMPVSSLLKLVGITEKKTPEGARRTAVILSDGQLYLAGVGDTVAGRYAVVAIDPEAVVLNDEPMGAEVRLFLR